MELKQSAIQERVLLVRDKKLFTRKDAEDIVKRNLYRTPYKRIDRVIIPEEYLETGVIGYLEDHGITCTVTFERR